MELYSSTPFRSPRCCTPEFMPRRASRPWKKAQKCISEAPCLDRSPLNASFNTAEPRTQHHDSCALKAIAVKRPTNQDAPAPERTLIAPNQFHYRGIPDTESSSPN